MDATSPLLSSLHWRYAAKAYNPAKKVTDSDLKELLEVLRLSPSSFGLQPWKFIVVADTACRQAVRAAAWDQSPVTDASHLIALCARTDIDEAMIEDHLSFMVRERQLQTEQVERYRSMMNGFLQALTPAGRTDWARRQVYIALGFLLEACALKRIDSTPMEGFSRERVDAILHLPKRHLTVAVLCTIGYRAEGDWNEQLPKARRQTDAVIEVL